MTCINPDMEKLVSLYQFNLLSEEEKLDVEAHLLECDACFEDLYRLSPAVEVLSEMPQIFMDALQPKKILFARILKGLKGKIEYLKTIINTIISTLIIFWKRPVVKILVPVTAAILLAIFFLIPSSMQLSNLAILEKAPYQTIRLRGADKLSPAEKLFSEGMNYYNQDNFNEAITKLATYLEREPDNVYGHFYLGVSLLLENKIENGIKHLVTASDLSKKLYDNQLLEKCYWHLGNGYLKINDVQNALKQFRKVVERHGEYEEDANVQILKIIEISKKKVNK